MGRLPRRAFGGLLAAGLAAAIALNDCSTEIPVMGFERQDVLLALKRDSERMPVRDKGPLFIACPSGSFPELTAQTFCNRSAWQPARLVVG